MHFHSSFGGQFTKHLSFIDVIIMLFHFVAPFEATSIIHFRFNARALVE